MAQDLKYDEKNPWGKAGPGSTIVTIGGDNIEFSEMRRNAIQAVKSRTATPEQHALVREADTLYQRAIRGEESEDE